MKKIAKPVNLVSMDACTSTRETGFVLIELIIMIFIGLLLISVLMEMFITSQNSIRLQGALADIQENANAAISILTTEIHQAGTTGCVRLSADFPIVPSQELNPANKFTGTSRNEIIVRYAEYPNVYLSGPMQNDITMVATRDIRFDPGDILIISNCKQAEIITVSKIRSRRGMQEITASLPLHHRYEKYAEISRFMVNKLYIDETDRKNRDGTKVFSLFVEDIHHNKNELVANINRMQMTYTVNRDGHLQEVSWREVSDWSQIVGVAIDIDLRSPPINKTWHMYAGL